MKLIFVRHTTPDIRHGICYGISDILPAATFKSEAAATMEKLEAYLPEKVYTSPLKRCSMLAGFCGYTHAIADSRLQEMDFGDWEMIDWKNIHGTYATKWMENYLTVPAPNGECLQDVVDRIESFMNEIKQNGSEQILCFTHSGPIRIMHHLVNNSPIDKLFDIEVDFGGVYEFEI
jgi:alpha-ribazole phosphatase